MERRRSRNALLASALLALWCAPAVAQSVDAGIAGPCLGMGTPERGANDLYCIDLLPTPDLYGAVGYAELAPAPTPFGVPVTADGHHRYTLVVHLEGLPDPAALGPYTTYVAWVMPPNLDPVVNLGPVGNGRTVLGEVSFNKFLVMITAEARAGGAARTGKLALRGRSPSSRMEAHDLAQVAPLAVMTPTGGMDAMAPGMDQSMDHSMDSTHTHGLAPPPMNPAVRMPPGMMGLAPRMTPFLPPGRAADYPPARPRERVDLADGDTLRLEAALVRRTIRGRDLVMYGFNGQYPGPLLHVPQAATVVVQFTNRTGWPTAVHWHGIRLDNRFDGVPGVTQEPVPPGGSFTYRVHFPDAGLYWYHPHHREDVQQDLGLYGNMLVSAPGADYYNPVNSEAVLMLDDLLLGDGGLLPYGAETSNFSMMGRFGNVFLVNGEPSYAQDVRRGEVVRFFLTNVSNTRTFNLSLGGLPVKVVGSDVSRYEHEVLTDNVVIAPAERYIVEVRFPEAGTVALTNRVQSIDHTMGRFFPEVDTLGLFHVAPEPVAVHYDTTFQSLRTHPGVVADIDRYRAEFARPVDHELVLTLEVEDLPPVSAQLMQLDAVYFNPVEWGRTMPVMNWATTGRQVHWILRDVRQGRDNMDIAWRFRVGDVVKLRLHNNRDAVHAMQHPVHIHGQRFLVLSVNGVPNDNLVWKDTMLLPAGATADVLLELSNPGRWMIHCHIAEHLESGMKMVFEVEE